MQWASLACLLVRWACGEAHSRAFADSLDLHTHILSCGGRAVLLVSSRCFLTHLAAEATLLTHFHTSCAALFGRAREGRWEAAFAGGQGGGNTAIVVTRSGMGGA